MPLRAEFLPRAATLVAFLGALVVSVVIVGDHGVTTPQALRFLGYVVVFLTLPGALLWRLLWTGGPGTLLEHAVFGTLLGAIVQLPVYVVGVAVGIPRLTALLPVGVVVFCLLRTDRAVLFRPPLEPVRPLLAWTVCLVFVYALLWETRLGWQVVPAWGTGPANPIGDQTFQAGLVAEMRHHFPPHQPFVDGLLLHYHWFVNAFLAAASWWVDVPIWVLLDRLLLPTFLFLVVASVGVTAQKVSGSPAVGALAAVILGLVGDFSPFRWSGLRSSFDERFLAYFDVVSPSLQSSVAFLMMAILVMMRLLTQDRPGRRDVILVLLVTMLLPLSKGTALPVLLGGLVTVIGFRLLTRQRVTRVVVALTGLVLVTFFVAQRLVFANEPTGMKVAPFALNRYVIWNLGLSPSSAEVGPATPVSVHLFAAVGLLLSWLLASAGLVGFARREGWRDPRPVLLAGIGASGLAAALIFDNAHLNQDYFARSVIAPLAVGSAWGLWWLVRERSRRTKILVVGGGMVAGGLTTLLAARAAPATRPLLEPGIEQELVRTMLRPYAVVGLVVLVVVGVLLALVRHRRLASDVAWCVVLSMVVGLGLARVPGTIDQVAGAKAPAAADARTASMGRGSVAAAEWLRGHSDPDDLVATNAHYLQPGSRDNRHFWIAAVTERRMLLEGWGYTARIAADADKIGTSFYVPYWDQDYLARHDAVFVRPSPDNIDFMTERGVRWLFVDDRYPSNVRALRRELGVAHHSGSYWVFELPDQGSARGD